MMVSTTLPSAPAAAGATPFEFEQPAIPTDASSALAAISWNETIMADNKISDATFLSLSGVIVAAYVRKNPVPANGIPSVIESVHAALKGLVAGASNGAGPVHKPAVPLKKSVTPDYIVCLEDGRKLKMLKRYLRTRYGLSPEAYRMKWHLPSDYPMVAPEYAARRSAFAKKIGLGRTRRVAGKRRKRG